MKRLILKGMRITTGLKHPQMAARRLSKHLDINRAEMLQTKAVDA